METFRSGQKQYRIKPENLPQLLDNLITEMQHEQERRRCSKTNLRPEFWLYICDASGDIKAYDYTRQASIEELYDTKIDIKATRVTGPSSSDWEGINMGFFSISPKGKRVTLKILPLEGLAINPQVIYNIGDRYSIND